VIFPQVEIGKYVKKIDTWNPLKSRFDDIFSYIDLSSVDKDKKLVDCSLVQSIEGKNAPSRARQLVKKTDVLISTVRPNLNGVAIVPINLDGATASTGYCVLRAQQSVLDPLYLFYWVQTKIFINDMLLKATGANYPAISDKIIKQSKIPLPPLPEQKKIADILDAADSLRQKDQQLVEHYDRLSQSLFLDMFGDVFNNTKGFSIALFSELVEKVQIGPFGSQLHKCDYVENGIPLINPVHIVNSKIIPNHAFSLRTEKYKSLPNYHLKAGDLIMGRRGEMGRCALVTEKEDGFFCGTGSLYLRLNNKVTPLFLMKTITSKSGKEYLERNAQGVTMMNLNKKIILNIEIGLPPIELQNKFETSICAIEKQKELAQQSLKKSEDLFNSLLQRAFKGELTHTQ